MKRNSVLTFLLLLQKLDSFLLAVSCCTGKVIYVSDRVEKLLGHAQVNTLYYRIINDFKTAIIGQVDMMGYQLSCFVHPSDLETFDKKLSAFAAQGNGYLNPTSSYCEMSFLATSNPESVDSLKGQVYSFECRLAGRQLSRGEPTVYERVSISGTFRGPRWRREWAEDFVKSTFNRLKVALSNFTIFNF